MPQTQRQREGSFLQEKLTRVAPTQRPQEIQVALPATLRMFPPAELCPTRRDNLAQNGRKSTQCIPGWLLHVRKHLCSRGTALRDTVPLGAGLKAVFSRGIVPGEKRQLGKSAWEPHGATRAPRCLAFTVNDFIIESNHSRFFTFCILHSVASPCVLNIKKIYPAIFLRLLTLLSLSCTHFLYTLRVYASRTGHVLCGCD